MGKVLQLFDGLKNVVTGLGVPGFDKNANASWSHTPLAREQLAAAYKSNYLASRIVDTVANDSVRNGRQWELGADDVAKIEAVEREVKLFPYLRKTSIRSRLFGGAAIFIGTGAEELSEPLDVDREDLQYLTCLSRRVLTAGMPERDVRSSDFGRPAHYDMTSGTGVTLRIHPSRLVRMVGVDDPDDDLGYDAHQGWGYSVLEPVNCAVQDAIAANMNVAHLINEANVDVFGIKHFTEGLARGGKEYEQAVVSRMQLTQQAKSVTRAILMDQEDSYDRKQTGFANLDRIMVQFLQIVAGASGIPATRLLGIAPGGLNSTGDADERIYFDQVAQDQNLVLTPALQNLDALIVKRALGSPTDEASYAWSPLRQMTEQERADIADKLTSAGQKMAVTGAFTSEEIRAGVSSGLTTSGAMPGLEQAMADTEDGDGFDLGGDDPNAPVTDAAPRTLYVRRDVVNAAEIIAWAKGQGFKTTLPADDMHVTIAFSRAPVDWMKVGQSWDEEHTVAAGGPRIMEGLGANGEAKVLLFSNTELQWRHEQMKRAGASWDWPEYQPHITISYDPDAPDLDDVEPYAGRIVLGPEKFQEIDDGWRSKIKEDSVSEND